MTDESVILDKTPVWLREKSAHGVEWLKEFDENKEGYLMTLTGGFNAQRFAWDCKGWLIYGLGRTEDYKISNWYVWDNTYWKRGDLSLIQKAAKSIVKFIQDELWYFTTNKEGKFSSGDCILAERQKCSPKDIERFVNKVSAHIKATDQKKGIEDMLYLAISIDGMSVNMMQKSNHNLIGLKNGIFDTLTGAWIPMEMARFYSRYYPTHYIDRVYTPGAKSDKYEKFIETLCTDNTSDDLDKETIVERRNQTKAYLMRLGGYNLVAGNPEQKQYFHVGDGSNGKSTLLSVWKIILGSDEAQACSIKEFNSSETEKPSPTLSQVAPKRLATFSEAAGSNDKKGEKVPISAEKFKSSTDSSTVDRGLYDKGGETVRLWKGHFATNDMPEFDHFDRGVSRRLVIIPYRHRFVEKSELENSDGLYTKDDLAIRDYEKQLTEGEEGDKILSMMIDECIRYRKEGMVELPEYCGDIAKDALVPERFMEFFEITYEEDNSADGGVLWSTIKSDYNKFIDRPDIYDKYSTDIDYKMTDVPGDKYSTKVRIASKKEVKLLEKAIQVMGFKPRTVHARGKKYPLRNKIH